MEPKPASSTVDEPLERQTAPSLTNPSTPTAVPNAPDEAATPIEQVTPVELVAPEATVAPEPFVAPVPEENWDENIVPPPVFTAPEPAKRRRPVVKILVILALVLNVALLTGNGLVYARNHKQADSTGSGVTANTAKKADTKTSNSKVTSSADSKTLHYKSEPLNLEFDYPIDWRIGSSADNSSINLTSASFPITGVSGETAAGTIKMTITSAAADTDGASMINDNSRIVKDSEPLTYSKPTAQQRTQTNISFIGYPTENQEVGISNVFVSGGNSYKASDIVGSKDYKKVDPHVSLYVDLCAAGKCIQALATSDFSLDTWHTNENLLKAKAVIQSMRFN